MTPDYNRDLVLTTFKSLKALLQQHGLNHPVTFGKLLFLSGQLRNRYRPPNGPLEEVWVFFEMPETKSALLAAKAWQKTMASQNKEAQQRKIADGLQKGKQNPNPNSGRTILGKSGRLAMHRAKPVSKDAAKSVGWPTK